MGTRGEWADEFVSKIGGQVTTQSRLVMLAWMRFEFGTSSPMPFAYNPQATTYRMPGSTDGNLAGVQNYPSWDVGMTATVNTIASDSFGYPAIRQAFAAGLDAATIADAVDASSWGSHPGQVLAAISGDVLLSDASLDIGEGGPGATPVQAPGQTPGRPLQCMAPFTNP